MVGSSVAVTAGGAAARRGDQETVFDDGGERIGAGGGSYGSHQKLRLHYRSCIRSISSLWAL